MSYVMGICRVNYVLVIFMYILPRLYTNILALFQVTGLVCLLCDCLSTRLDIGAHT